MFLGALMMKKNMTMMVLTLPPSFYTGFVMGIMKLIMILLWCVASCGEDDGDANMMCGEALMKERR